MVLQHYLALVPTQIFIITATSTWLIIVKFCSVLYYQVHLDNRVSMHKLFAWFLCSTLVLMFEWLQNLWPLGFYTCYLTNHSLCTIWLHSNRNEEYFRSILIGSSDNVISRAEHSRRRSSSGYTAKPSKFMGRSHGLVKTPAEQNCMAKRGENECKSLQFPLQYFIPLYSYVKLLDSKLLVFSIFSNSDIDQHIKHLKK